MILLTNGAMVRCANEGDWVRREIEIALKYGKRIVPVNPDGTYDGMPTNVPQEIKSAIDDTQHSEINFGQTLNVTVDQMVKNRIRPYVHHNSWSIWLGISVGVCAIIIIGYTCWQYKKASEAVAKIELLKQEITFQGNSISWPDTINKSQLLAINEIFDNMQLIEGGEFMQGAELMSDGNYHKNVEIEFETPAHKETIETFYMSKFEVTRGQWNAIMDDHREGKPDLPIDSVTFYQAKAFAEKLFDITGQLFKLPTEAEWEYAAKGGSQPEEFMFAGSDNPDDVAWYAKNSGGKSHADLRATATINDLFNMSGNVSEWCDNVFKPYDKTVSTGDEKTMVVRGGNYDSEEYEITTTHREPTRPDTAIPTLGFRLVIQK
jgi:formylglycine-generating enzyme required for sulfatase activity